MAKKIKANLKLQIPAGQANPAPPIGPALGQHGVNIQDFCKQFNDRTKEMGGDVVPADITVFEDRSFVFKIGTPPASYLLKKAARPLGEAPASQRGERPDGAIGIEKGSGDPAKNKVGVVSKAQIHEIAEKKMADLNATTLETAEKIIEGTAHSMGITVE